MMMKRICACFQKLFFLYVERRSLAKYYENTNKNKYNIFNKDLNINQLLKKSSMHFRIVNYIEEIHCLFKITISLNA
jgi:hypothetical protein